MNRVQYVLEAFEKDGDAFVKQIDVTHIPQPELQRIFGVVDDRNLYDGERDVSQAHADQLRAYLDETLDMDHYDWFFGARQITKES